MNRPHPNDIPALRLCLEREATPEPIVRPTGPQQAELLARLAASGWLRVELYGYVLTDEGRELAGMALELREVGV